MKALAVAEVSMSHRRPCVSAKKWLVPRARASSRPRSRAASSATPSREARRTNALGTPTRLSLLCTELLTLPTPREFMAVSYTHLRAHETDSYLVCRLLLDN